MFGWVGVATIGAAVSAGVISAGGCARDPLDAPCPTAAVGGLVVTELSGPKAGGDDGLGQWIELHNPGAEPVGLGGLGVRLRKLDGSGDVRLIVRDAGLTVAAGGYVVLGRFAPGDEPAHVDYGYAGDFAGDLYGAGVVDLDSCGTLVDRASWTSLPGVGTRRLSGGAAPSAITNDDTAAWCDGAATDGSPKAANPPCP